MGLSPVSSVPLNVALISFPQPFFPQKAPLKCTLINNEAVLNSLSMYYSLCIFQCDVCLCWQHALCMEITNETLPKKYICYICANPPGQCKTTFCFLCQRSAVRGGVLELITLHQSVFLSICLNKLKHFSRIQMVLHTEICICIYLAIGFGMSIFTCLLTQG